MFVVVSLPFNFVISSPLFFPVCAVIIGLVVSVFSKGIRLDICSVHPDRESFKRFTVARFTGEI
jgi:hypothetical protein